MDIVYKHELDKQARKYIAKLDKPRQKLIIEGIEGLPLNGDIKPIISNDPDYVTLTPEEQKSLEMALNSSDKISLDEFKKELGI